MSARGVRRRGALLGALIVVVPMALVWGFTVDDAFIVARVAAHIARGIGHRFNAFGPVSDAVTPLGFAYLVAPLSRGSVLGAFHFAKWFGAIAGALSSAILGAKIASNPGQQLRFAPLFLLGCSLPFAAWCVAGLETGIVVLLATVAISNFWLAPLFAGLAAAWRPEMIPWAVVLAVGRAAVARRRPRDVLFAILAALGPAALVSSIRLASFGHPLPLAFWAKPSDFAHGAFYAAGALIWCGAPLLIIARPRTLRSLGGDAVAIVLAVAAHLAAMVLAGGDWMPSFRLFVPMLPGLVWVGALLASTARPRATLLRASAAIAVSSVLFVSKVAASRGVGAQRLALIREIKPALRHAHRIAALDIGWVGAATELDIVDLAGVTDESIARLVGGHTSKRVSPHLLESRRVDTLVLLYSGEFRGLGGTVWARTVEDRIAREAAGLGFEPRASLKLSGTALRYAVFELQSPPQWSENTER